MAAHWEIQVWTIPTGMTFIPTFAKSVKYFVSLWLVVVLAVVVLVVVEVVAAIVVVAVVVAVLGVGVVVGIVGYLTTLLH
jgi:hypothetical protein